MTFAIVLYGLYSFCFTFSDLFSIKHSVICAGKVSKESLAQLLTTFDAEVHASRQGGGDHESSEPQTWTSSKLTYQETKAGLINLADFDGLKVTGTNVILKSEAHIRFNFPGTKLFKGIRFKNIYAFAAVGVDGKDTFMDSYNELHQKKTIKKGLYSVVVYTKEHAGGKYAGFFEYQDRQRANPTIKAGG